MDLAFVQQLLYTLTNTKNKEERINAEKLYQQLLSEPDQYIELIVQSIELNNELSRAAIIFLKSNIDKSSRASAIYNTFNGVQGAHPYMIRLLHCLARNPDTLLATIIAGHAFVQMNFKQPFQELQDFLNVAIQNENQQIQIIAYALMAQLMLLRLKDLQEYYNIDFMKLFYENIGQTHLKPYVINAFTNMLIINDFTDSEKKQIRELCVQQFIISLNTDIKQADKLTNQLDSLYKDVIPDLEEFNSFLLLAQQIMSSDLDSNFKSKIIEIITSMVKNLGGECMQALIDFDCNVLVKLLGSEQTFEEWQADLDDAFISSNVYQSVLSSFEIQAEAIGFPIIKELIIILQNEPEQLLLILFYQMEYLHSSLDEETTHQIYNYCKECFKSNNVHVRYNALVLISEMLLEEDTTFLLMNTEAISQEVFMVVSEMVKDSILKVQVQALNTIVNVMTTIGNHGIIRHSDEILKIAEFAFQLNSFSAKGASLAILSIISELLPRNQMSHLLQQVIPVILGEFQDIIHKLSTDKELSFQQEHYVARVVECISFAVTCNYNLFDAIKDQIILAMIQMVKYAVDYRLDKIVPMGLGALRRMSRCFSYEPYQFEFLEIIKMIIEQPMTTCTDNITANYTFDIQAKQFKQNLLEDLNGIFFRQNKAFQQIFTQLQQLLSKVYVIQELEIYGKFKAQSYLIDILESTNQEIQYRFAVEQLDNLKQYFNDHSVDYFAFHVCALAQIPRDLAHILQYYLMYDLPIELIDQLVHFLQIVQQTARTQVKIEELTISQGNEYEKESKFLELCVDYTEFWRVSAGFYEVFLTVLGDKGLPFLQKYGQLNFTFENELDLVNDAIDQQPKMMSYYIFASIIRNVSNIQPFMQQCSLLLNQQATSSEFFFRSVSDVLFTLQLRNVDLSNLSMASIQHRLQEYLIEEVYSSSLNATLTKMTVQLALDFNSLSLEELEHNLQVEYLIQQLLKFNQELLIQQIIPFVFGPRCMWFVKNFEGKFSQNLKNFLQMHENEVKQMNEEVNENVQWFLNRFV
ncbi:Importin_beta-3 subunit [Hexamita inflata]|uniref:Importin_beta-3 subunit n=1 Tax=Hexamita inflata TaxID=28002 RepID=A0ABP1GJ63_9EUKA